MHCQMLITVSLVNVVCCHIDTDFFSLGIITCFLFYFFSYLFGHDGSLLWHLGSSVAACGISFPDQGLNPGPVHGCVES